MTEVTSEEAEVLRQSAWRAGAGWVKDMAEGKLDREERLAVLGILLQLMKQEAPALQRAWWEGAQWLYETLTEPNFQERLVMRTDLTRGVLTTVRSRSDGWQPFELALSHPEFDGGTPVVIGSYSEREAAVEDHVRWMTLLLTGDVQEVTDISNSKMNAQDYRRVVTRTEPIAEQPKRGRPRKQAQVPTDLLAPPAVPMTPSEPST